MSMILAMGFTSRTIIITLGCGIVSLLVCRVISPGTRKGFVLAYSHIQRAGRETRRRDIVQAFFAVSEPHVGAVVHDKHNVLPLRLIPLLAMQQPVADWPSLLFDTPQGASQNLS